MTKAKNAGFTPADITDADKDDITTEVDLAVAMKGGTIEPVGNADDASLNEIAQNAQFMSHELDVTFSEPRDENDFMSVRAGVNGISYEYPRNNTPCKVPRHVVEVLARSRVQRVRTVEGKAPDGARMYTPQVTESVTYPFAVVGDPAGDRGRRWLQRVLSEKLL